MPTPLKPPPNLLPAPLLPKNLLRGREQGRTARFYPDLNVSKAARAMECSQSHLCNILNGKMSGTLPLLEKIASTLGISLDELARIRHMATEAAKQYKRRKRRAK